MREHTHTRNRVRKKAHFFRMFSMIAFIISWMALEPLGGQFLLANSYSLFWLFVHFVSYILMGFTVYLQAKAARSIWIKPLDEQINRKLSNVEVKRLVRLYRQ